MWQFFFFDFLSSLSEAITNSGFRLKDDQNESGCINIWSKMTITE